MTVERSDAARRWGLPLLAILMLAFTLRVSKLADQAIWWDEAWSILLAEQPLPDITRTIAFDAHPPLYQWALHVWIRLAGISEFAARYFSALAGVVTVALCAALARRLTGSRHAALAAGLITALSVISIHWSQEARMYALGAMWAAGAAYAYARLIERPSARWALALAVTAACAPLTQYLAGFVVVAVGLHALATQRTWTFWRWWGLAMGTATVLVGGWIAYALTLAARTPRPTDHDLIYPLQLWWAALVNGSSSHIEQYDLPALVLAGVVVTGSIVGLVRRQRGVLLGALLVGLPPLFYWAVNVALTLPLTDRYYALMAPTGLVGVVACTYPLTRIPRLRALTAVIGLALGLFGLMAVWRSWESRYLQDDYHTLMQAVDLLAEPGDTLFFISGERYPLVLYPLRKRYYPAPTPYRIHGVPSGDDWEPTLARLTADVDRAWLIFAERTLGDGGGVREAFLRQAYRVEAEVAVGHNGYALLTRLNRSTYPQQGATLPPAVHVLRPGDAVRVGVPAGVTAALQVGETILQQVTPTRWEVVSFTIHPIYPNGEYLLRVGDRRFSVRVTHAQPQHAPAEPLADFGVMRLRAADVEEVAGRGLRLRLLWEAVDPSDAPLNVFVHVVGPWNPQAGNPIWGQNDGQPVGTPLALWPTGTMAVETRLVPLPALPPGHYELRVGLYNWTTGKRVLLPNGQDGLLLREWEVR
jgi:4-amino-4-deoxy-L-arabinose transferase-like glycosyltransferase